MLFVQEYCAQNSRASLGGARRVKLTQASRFDKAECVGEEASDPTARICPVWRNDRCANTVTPACLALLSVPHASLIGILFFAQAPAADLSAPDANITAPSGSVDLPSGSVDKPAASVDAPSGSVDVGMPPGSADMPPGSVDVPSGSADMSGEVPGVGAMTPAVEGDISGDAPTVDAQAPEADEEVRRPSYMGRITGGVGATVGAVGGLFGLSGRGEKPEGEVRLSLVIL